MGERVKNFQIPEIFEFQTLKLTVLYLTGNQIFDWCMPTKYLLISILTGKLSLNKLKNTEFSILKVTFYWKSASKSWTQEYSWKLSPMLVVKFSIHLKNTIALKLQAIFLGSEWTSSYHHMDQSDLGPYCLHALMLKRKIIADDISRQSFQQRFWLAERLFLKHYLILKQGPFQLSMTRRIEALGAL